MKAAFQRVLLLLGLIAALLVMGTIAFHLIEGWTLFDGFYMTLMTLTTVGFGEIHPLSLNGRIVASLLMLAGVAAVFISVGVMVDLIIKLELADYFGRKRRQHMLEKLSNHYIVCGAGRVGRSVVRELRRSGGSTVVDRYRWTAGRMGYS